MKRKSFIVFLCAELAALVGLSALTSKYPLIFSSLIAFPFEQIGRGLRFLSLSGRTGNGLALSIWVGLSALPLIPAMRNWDIKDQKMENMSLCLLSFVLFAGLFNIANPGVLFSSPFDIDKRILYAVNAIIIWSVVILCVILRLIRLYQSGGLNELLRYTKSLLYILCFLFVGVIAVSCGQKFAAMLASINHPMDVAMTIKKNPINAAMTVISFIAMLLPYLLDVIITFSSIQLLDMLIQKKTDGLMEAAKQLSRQCCICLGLTPMSVIILNFLQLLLSRWLSNISISAQIPLMSIAFVLGIFLICQLISENLRLQADNDLFI